MYMQGAYIYHAIGAFAEILPAFPAKGAKIHPYLEKPFCLDIEEKERRAEAERQRKFNEFKQKFLKRMEEINKRK